MAFDGISDSVRGAFTGRGYDEPGRLSNPQVFLLSMVIFLAIVGFLAAILYRQISAAFVTNPGLNSLILGVLVVGIVLVFLQVTGLFREVRWVNSVREGGTLAKDERAPVLLAPMRTLLSRNERGVLTTLSMRTILDSIATRLDESRDISRYLIGLLVFLGLLGTFWGLLQTIGSIGSTIQSLDPGSGNTNDILDSLKAGLAAPLEGMGTAFSSSLFGLSGSLVLGFLDLQAGRAQNRFYTELENWLSTVTAPDTGALAQDAGNLARDVKTMSGTNDPRTQMALANLADGIQGLVKSMRGEQQMMRNWAESQAEEQKEIRKTLDNLARAINDQKSGR